MGILVALALLAVAVVAVLLASKRRTPAVMDLWTRVLRWGAVVAALMAAALLVPDTKAESGMFALVLLGVPVAVCALAAFVSEVAEGGAGRVAAWAGALLMLAWVLLLGLGVGLAFAPAALLLVCAASASESRDRVTASSGSRRRRSDR
jgi:hypothetical protein